MDKLVTFFHFLDWFNILRVSGVLLTIYLFLKNCKIMRADWLVLAKFFAFMMFITAARFAYMDIVGLPPGAVAMNGVSLSTFFWVFWEDAIFSMPIYYLKDYKKFSKWIWIPAAVLLSVGFWYGHRYYGWIGLIALIPPYFISYKLGKKHGYGTVMIGHILYDFVGVIALKLFMFLKFFMV